MNLIGSLVGALAGVFFLWLLVRYVIEPLVEGHRVFGSRRKARRTAAAEQAAREIREKVRRDLQTRTQAIEGDRLAASTVRIQSAEQSRAQAEERLRAIIARGRQNL